MDTEKMERGFSENPYSFKDLVDIERLRDIFERFSQATGFTTGLVSYPEQELLIATGWRDICTKFHRACPVSEVHCKQSNLYLTSKLDALEKLNIRPCENGLVDGATPIIVDGVHLASLFTGQILFEKPDIERFKNQAENYGYDVAAYLEALNEVPVVNENKFREVMAFLCHMAVMLAEAGLREQRLQQMESERKWGQEALKESERKYRLLADNVTDVIWLLDTDLKFTYISPSVRKLRGYTPEEALQIPLEQTFTPESYQKAVKTFVEEMDRNGVPGVLPDRSVFLELDTIRKDGGVTPVEINASFLRDEAGSPVGIIGITRDIAERKHAERAVRESEGKLRAMFDASPLAIVLLDRKGKVLDSNEELGSRLQMTRDQVLGKCIWDVLPESARLHRKNDVETVFKTGEPLFGEDKRGDIWNEYYIHPAIKNKAGEIEAVIVEGLDITERKLKDEKLHLQSLVLDQIQDRVTVTDLNGVITYVNEAEIQTLGYERDELIGVSVEKFGENPERGASQREIVEETLSKGWWRGEVVNYSADGSERIMDCRTTTIKDAQGKPIALAGISTDVTDLKKAEEELRKSESRFRDLSEMLPETVFETDLDMNLTFVNQQAFSMFGYLQKDVEKGINGYDMLVPEDRGRARDNAIKRLKGENIGVNEYRGLRKNGTSFPVLFHTSPVIKNMEIVGLRGIIVDISEQKKVEKQLREAQKMESIGNLAGGIAHDFNNLLFPIIGISELLMEDLHPESTEYESIKEILKAGKRGRDLVKQILAFSRQSEHKMIPVRIQQILKDVIKLSRSTIPVYIEISQNIQPDCGLVLADAIQIHQVAMNLITNAFHAVEHTDGKIDVQLKEIIIEAEDVKNLPIECGKYAMLAVSDTGPGIEQSIMDKIFEPYFTTKEQGKGTGLGLAVVYGIVKEHRGEIKVYSELNKGTTFTVYLPLMEKSDETMSVAKEMNCKTGTERILLIDDEKAIAQIEKQLLERLGYQVTARTCSPDALEAFKTDPDAFDLVITDMNMPNMTGDKLAQELISIRPDIPVIICTGFSERINEKKAKIIGIKGFLMKPVVMTEMAKMVREVLDDANGSDSQ